MNKFLVTVAFIILGLPLSSIHASAGIVNFEDTGGTSLVYRGLSFDDQGLTFKPATSTFQYTVDGSQPSPSAGVNNGTNFYIASPVSAISLTSGGTFSVNQLDLGLSLFTLPTQNAVLTGFFSDGSSFSTTVSLNNSSFQTFVLNGFNDIDRLNVSLSNGFVAIDNIHFSENVANVPEPITTTLLGIGFLSLAASRCRSAKSKNT